MDTYAIIFFSLNNDTIWLMHLTLLIDIPTFIIAVIMRLPIPNGNISRA
jgi:uncharacterized membrane protein YgaE (UPF0421/DUF939 family)